MPVSILSKTYFHNGVEHHGLKKCGACRKQFTVRVGTVFESSHVPLTKWLQAAYLITPNLKRHKQTASRISLAVLTALFGWADISYARDTKTDTSNITHMLQLKCYGADDITTISRFAVLDVSGIVTNIRAHRKYDYGFIAGHGLKPEKPCFVKDFEGHETPIIFHTLSNNYAAGTQADWGIIKFKRMKTRNLERYKIMPLEDAFIPVNDQAVEFAKARGLRSNTQDCQISSLTFPHYVPSKVKTYMTHNCRAVSGQSGSPLIQTIDNRTQLIGLHLGELWMHKSPKTGRPARVKYVKLFDKKTVDQIQDILNGDLSQITYPKYTPTNRQRR